MMYVLEPSLLVVDGEDLSTASFIADVSRDETELSAFWDGPDQETAKTSVITINGMMILLMVIPKSIVMDADGKC